LPARELLDLVGLLGRVETPDQANLWMRAFVDWHSAHEKFINEKSVDEESGRWWYTHKMLHRSDTHIRRALPEMFAYTRHVRVPKSSNSIEAFFRAPQGQHEDTSWVVERALSRLCEVVFVLPLEPAQTTKKQRVKLSLYPPIFNSKCASFGIITIKNNDT
jgi:hypothetical protein